MEASARVAYSAAKGGIAALTLVESAEMGRYGVHRERDRGPGGGVPA